MRQQFRALNILQICPIDLAFVTVRATTLDGLRAAREQARKATVTRLEELIRRQSRKGT